MIESRIYFTCKTVHFAARSALHLNRYLIMCQASTLEARAPGPHTHSSNVHRCGVSPKVSAALPAACHASGRQTHIKQPDFSSILTCSAATQSPKSIVGSESYVSRSKVGSHSTKSDKDGDVAIRFVSDDVRTMAKAGENLWAVAERCNVSIPLSCGRGDCGSCEMEVKKWELSGIQGGTSVVRTCIAAVPPGYGRLEIDSLEDDIWGADGYDT